MGWLGSGARSCPLCAFTLVLFSCPRKLRNGNCERGRKGNVDSERVESKCMKGGPLT